MGADDRVHAVWPTVIPGDNPTGAIFYATLAPGADRFSRRQRVPTPGTPKPSHPQVAVDGTGRLSFAWDQIVGGVRVAAVNDADAATGGALQFAPAVRLGDSGPTSYPVMAPLARGVVVAWVSGPPASGVIMVKRLAAGSSATAR